jgi:protein involved in polysaccharide export with SLBB domain
MSHYKSIVNRLLVSLFILSVCCMMLPINALAQEKPALEIQNLNTVKIDDLTDEQILNFWKKAKSNNINKAKLELLALERKMPEKELNKLLTRIDKLEEQVLKESKIASEKKNGDKQKKDDVLDEKKQKDRQSSEELTEEELTERTISEAFEMLEIKVFGAELFNNKKLTFEPSLNIPTPSNYQLGGGDELNIDVYGYSEASYTAKVSPDGFIRLEGVGVIQVGGNSIEQAKGKITAQLRQVYQGMSSGQTQVSITLSNIRSIKVNIIGEVNMPGTYLLPSVASVFNALYASGGPNNNGSFRNITIIRGGKPIATVDIYDFLVKGDSKKNISLKEQDIIKVNAYQKRVQVKGLVKRPAYFEVLDKETLKDLLVFAGGFAPNAFEGKIKVQRNTASQKSIADVNKELYGMFLPENGDIYTVGEVLDRFENRVSIEGAVFRPGDYALEKGLTTKKLIEKAEGLKEDAFATRAIIYRLKDDNELEMLSFNLGELMSGLVNDIPLRREDKIVIASKMDMREAFKVRIEGEVLKPGEFEYAEKMKLQDLIIAAGGLKESASIKKIQVGRRIETADRQSLSTNISEVFSVDIEKDLKDYPEVQSFELKPFDIVTVFPNPGYIVQTTIKVTGQVMYPGDFVINKSAERISDVIKRAGGITNDAFPEGAILIRDRSNTINQRVITMNKTRALNKVSNQNDAKDIAESDEFNRQFDLVAIDLPRIMKKPGGKEDILITDKDILNIPKKQQTVMISGEVLFPVKVVYQSNLSFHDYISNSGGFTSSALKRKAYVVYANGSAKSTKHFLFFTIRPKLKPGAEIIVPPKEKRERMSTAETISIVTASTTVLILLSTLLK